MRVVLTIIILGTVCAAGTARAAVSTATVGVSANLQPTCSASAASLAFGAYTPGAGGRNANAAIRIRCTRNTAFSVALNAGITPGASLVQRRLASGVNTLQYNLFTTAARTTVFGDGSGSTATRSGTGGGLATVRTIRVFGQLPDNAANRTAVPGSYSDTITVTVSY